MTQEANPQGEPQQEAAPDKQLEELKSRYDTLEKSHKSVQRELQRVREAGSSTRNLEERLRVNEEAAAVTLELLGKLAKAAELPDVADVATVITKLRTQPKPPAEDAAKVQAGTNIVLAAEAAGIEPANFDETWQSDARFAEARAYWNSGRYDLAVGAFQGALIKKTKTFSEEEVKKAVDEALAKDKRAAAGELPPSTTAQTNERRITGADLKKMTPAQRNALAKDIRKALLQGT